MSHEIRRYESYDAWEADEYEGRYVLFEDHLAVIARVREDERTYTKQTSTAIMAYDEGRRDGYAAALRDAIAAVRSREDSDHFPWPQVLIATAAITDLQP